jgi:hypothetical protein
MAIYIQYGKAEKLESLISGLEPNLIIDEFLFRKNFFNIFTCGTTGLNQWGLLLNRTRTILVPNYTGTFGFGDILGLPPEPEYPRNYDHGNFYSGANDLVALPDDQYRTLLLFTYAYLTSNFSLLSANKIMNTYCSTFDPPLTVQISTIGVKRINFDFNGFLLPWQAAIFALPGVLPVPLGVSFTLS